MIEETNEVIKEEPTPKKIETCEDWQAFFTQLAKPSCSKCYGRGYTGWKEFEQHGKMPIGCSAKGCAIHNLRLLQYQERMRQMKIKQEEKKKEREENVNSADNTELAD
jgi:hypothetical protein